MAHQSLRGNLERVSKEEFALLAVKKVEDKTKDLAHAPDTLDKVIEKEKTDLEAKKLKRAITKLKLTRGSSTSRSKFGSYRERNRSSRQGLK